MTPEQDEAWEKERRQRAQREQAMWNSIFRKGSGVIQGWRTCDIRECQRNRECSSDTFACLDKWRAKNPRVYTQEEIAKAMADLKRMLEAKIAERRAQESEETAAAKTGPAKRARGGERER